MGLSRWEFTLEFKLAALRRPEMEALAAEVARVIFVGLAVVHYCMYNTP